MIYWQDDEWYVGRIKERPDVFSQGETLEELEENILDAYQLLEDTVMVDLPSDYQTKEILLEAE